MKVNVRNPLALGMAAGGVALMLVAVLVDTAFKPMTQDAALAPGKKKIQGYQLDTRKSEKVRDETLALVSAKLWTDPDEIIAPKALTRVTAIAQRNGLKVTTFRPQKEIPASSLTLLPISASVEGPFPNVAKFVRDFEDNEPLLVIEALQITASDESTNKVTVTINIDAYIDPNRPVAKVSAAPASSKTTKTTKIVIKNGAPAANGKKAPSEKLTPGPATNSNVKKS